MRIKFYETTNGRSPVREFLEGQSESTRFEIFDALSLLEQGRTLSMPLSKNLASILQGLHELRFRDRVGQLRVIYYIRKSEAIYLVHAFRKKAQKLPRKEVELILKRVREIC